MITCPLCQKPTEKLHKKSHITPEWMNRECYENRVALKVNPITQKVSQVQSGLYGSIICELCEARSSKFDRYASVILTNKSPDSFEARKIHKNTIQINNDGTQAEAWTGIDFKLFQNFVFFTVLKAHLLMSKSDAPLLTEKEFDSMRTLYENDKIIDDQTFPINLLKSPDNDNLKNILFNPYPYIYENYTNIVFRGAGIAFFVCLPSKHIEMGLLIPRLKKEGSAVVLVDQFKNSGIFKVSAPAISDTIVKARKRFKKPEIENL